MTPPRAAAPPGWLARIGTRLAPPRFVLFVAVMLAAAILWHSYQHDHWSDALVIGFDLGVLAFTASLWPLGNDHGAADMRQHAAENDANRGWVLAITMLVSLAMMLAMIAELPGAHAGKLPAIIKLVGTLALGWLFVSLTFALHYAHMFYGAGDTPNIDRGGFEFPGTAEPDYWDFIYFSFTAGMSFAASDVNVTSGAVRKVVAAQCLLSFLFNIGALAFCINVLAGAAGS